MRRATLIVNPFSSAVTPRVVEAVEAALRARVELETVSTRAPGHATELAAAAAEAGDAVVVLSGDGTYNEAVNGAAGRRPDGVPAGRRDERPAPRARAPAHCARRLPRSWPTRSHPGASGGSRSGG